MGARPATRSPMPSPWAFQSTRPHGGATRCNRRLLRLQPISIHAPAWGRDLQSTAPDKASGNFNPRALVGRDLPSACRGSWIDSISIHAPSWGATMEGPCGASSTSYFNPRALVGRDRAGLYRQRRGCNFNPRALVGRDKSSMKSLRRPHHFNPRALVGRDTSRRRRISSSNDFNPRALVGRDVNPSFLPADVAGFQSTRPRGARPCRPCGLAGRSHFNPRALVGRDASR